MSAHDALADRCKRFERAEAGRRALPGIPLLARLDGRAFHTFTRGLARPWDERLGRCMVETTRTLVDALGARVGYTQSDEITLLWWVPSAGPTDYPFDGRFQKLVSVASGLGSAAFTRLISEHLPEKSSVLACFDARVWQVPSPADALDVFVWREDDATKNSLSMAARALYSHAEIHGKAGPELHALLHARGVNWNDYPARYKRGVYVQRQSFERTFSEAELERIPERYRPSPAARVTRSEVRTLDLPPIRRVANAVEVLFEGAAPIGMAASAPRAVTELVVLCGIPGSGKSTFCRLELGDYALVSKDRMGRARHKEARQMRLVRAALLAGRPVVVDNTHLTRATRAGLLGLTRELGVPCRAVVLQTPLERALARNAARGPSTQVPVGILLQMAASWEMPTPEEGFDRVDLVAGEGPAP